MERSFFNQPQGFTFGNLTALTEIKKKIFRSNEKFFSNIRKIFFSVFEQLFTSAKLFPSNEKIFPALNKNKEKFTTPYLGNFIKEKKPFLLPPWLQSDTRVPVGQCQKETANVYYYLNCFHANLIIFKAKILTQ
jgi:hypothetical protein